MRAAVRAVVRAAVCSSVWQCVAVRAVLNAQCALCVRLCAAVRLVACSSAAVCVWQCSSLRLCSSVWQCVWLSAAVRTVVCGSVRQCVAVHGAVCGTTKRTYAHYHAGCACTIVRTATPHCRTLPRTAAHCRTARQSILFYFGLFDFSFITRTRCSEGSLKGLVVVLFYHIFFVFMSVCFIFVCFWNVHQVLVGLPQGVGDLAILFYFILYHFVSVVFITRTRCSWGSPKGLMAWLCYFIICHMCLFS
jgi:hypothetical protein